MPVLPVRARRPTAAPPGGPAGRRFERAAAPVRRSGLHFSVGDTAIHKTFGTGVVLKVTPMGNDTLLEIAFDRAGTKKLMANYANLSKPE